MNLMKQYTKWIVVAVIAVFTLMGIGTYNSLTNKEVAVDQASSQIDVQLQRRAELIPNLVNTVKGYASHEKETLTKITEARAKLQDPNATLKDKAAADGELTSALNRLMMVQENYPQLKADQHFTELMRELSGTENRVTVARTRYNNAVADYNASTKRFPTNVIAGICGFQQKDLLEATADEKKNPEVKF